jgi:hypothetical protein
MLGLRRLETVFSIPSVAKATGFGEFTAGLKSRPFNTEIYQKLLSVKPRCRSAQIRGCSGEQQVLHFAQNDNFQGFQIIVTTPGVDTQLY